MQNNIELFHGSGMIVERPEVIISGLLMKGAIYYDKCFL